MRLGDAAEVRSGLVLARKSSRTPTPHCYPLLNLRSIKDDGYIDLEDLDLFHATEALQSDYISQVGDIVIRLSAPYTAVLIVGETAGMVVSSNFAIVRADRQQIIPSYLYWLLNTPKVKKRIYENTTSNMLLFAPSKLITEGGPQNSTNVLMYEVYKSAFRNGNMSRAGAITAILLVIIMITVIGQFKMMYSNQDD